MKVLKKEVYFGLHISLLQKEPSLIKAILEDYGTQLILPENPSQDFSDGFIMTIKDKNQCITYFADEFYLFEIIDSPDNNVVLLKVEPL